MYQFLVQHDRNKHNWNELTLYMKEVFEKKGMLCIVNNFFEERWIEMVVGSNKIELFYQEGDTVLISNEDIDEGNVVLDFCLAKLLSNGNTIRLLHLSNFYPYVKKINTSMRKNSHSRCQPKLNYLALL
ncbi:hypothetical protein [Pseudalkalibacillus decolorationis]|uniref:hypothetical protein n=1 Tax=Pseudalkalibacillus decolorationis TaxID=163879 RepID=UPI00214840DE|nr:hypothetical protein [Pseudalkalibacillus decolorationis]